MSQRNNDKIKELLSKTTVNTDFDLQWDTISGRMDEDENKRKVFWWLFAVATLLVSAIFCMYNANSNTIVLNPINDSTIQSTIESNRPSDNLESMKSKEQETKQATFGNSQSTTLASMMKEPSVSKSTIKPLSIKPQHLNTTGKKQDNYQSKTESKYLSFDHQFGIMNSANNSDRPQSQRKINTNTFNDPAILPIDTEQAQDTKTQNLQRQITKILLPLSISRSNNLRNETDELTIEDEIQPINASNKYLYTNIVSWYPQTKILDKDNNSYRKLLTDGFKTLSRYSFSLGAGMQVNPTWRIYTGFQYQNTRFVYRGNYTTSSSQIVPSDTAIVLVNTSGGNLYQAGDITETTTTNYNLQQYNYFNSLGLTLGTQHTIFGPVYAGVEVSWSPFVWQTGQMFNSSLEVVPLSSIANQSNTLLVNLELGAQFPVAKTLLVDLGVNYQPAQPKFSLENVTTTTGQLGASFRVIYSL